MFLCSLLYLERGEPETTYLGSSGSNSQKGFDRTEGFKLEYCGKVQCANITIDVMIACFEFPFLVRLTLFVSMLQELHSLWCNDCVDQIFP